jgi:two-component system NarL family response regulator
MAERNRIAREIHDTLAGGLGAIAVHADLLLEEAGGGESRVRPHVEILQGLVRRSLADARSSIWNMRAPVLEERDLAAALVALARQLGDGTGVEVVSRVEGRARRLPSTTENHLLRIAQEAVVNATKHARATRIDVELAFHDTEVRLGVRDNGRGFDVSSSAGALKERSPSGNGLGLVGMRERAAELHGDLLVQSAPGQGTLVRLTVPVGLTHRLRLLVVDDHPAFRAGLIALLGAQHDMEVVAEAGDAETALAAYRRERPDVVLMDLRMPGTGGVEIITRLGREFPEARVIVVTTFDADEDIHRAMQAGAKSYLLKGMSKDEIAGTIRAVYAGQQTLPADVARRLAERRQRAELTPREVDVLHLLTEGRSNKEIAAALFIAEDTVKGHLKTLFAKLGVQDRTEAAISAVRHGIVHLD